MPDVVIAEELLSVHGESLVQAGLLQAVELPGDLVIETAALMRRYRRPSQNDLFGLALAKAERLVLLTGDAALRHAAETEGIEAHGVLWLIDGLIERSGLTAAEACIALRKVIESGARLPDNEVKSRLAIWCDE